MVAADITASWTASKMSCWDCDTHPSPSLPPPLSVSIYHIFIVYPHSVQMHPSPSLRLIIPLVKSLCGQIAALSMKSSSKREGTAVTASMCYWVFARVLLSVWCVSSPVHARERACVSRPISEGLIDRLKDSVCRRSASLAQVLESVCAHDSVCVRVCVFSVSSGNCPPRKHDRISRFRGSDSALYGL